MPRFILNSRTQENGEHEVHNATYGCSHMPAPENRVNLGNHNTCHEAIRTAKGQWPNNKINGCVYCCKPCHTS